MTAHFAYFLAWAFFALGHIGLAQPPAKVWLARRFGRRSRIAYNLTAVAQLALVAAVGAAALGGRPGFALPPWLAEAMVMVHVAGWAVLVGALFGYDLGRLAGTAQLKGAAEDEPLRTDGIHAHLRHPLYAGGFLILWGAAGSPLGLATALWGSAVLLAGTWTEERKLLGLYGAAYADYRRRVPAYLPRWRPGRRP